MKKMEKFKEKKVVILLDKIGVFYLIGSVFIPLPAILLVNKYSDLDIDRMWAFILFILAGFISTILFGISNGISDKRKYTKKFLEFYNNRLLCCDTITKCHDLGKEILELATDDDNRIILDYKKEVIKLVDDLIERGRIIDMTEKRILKEIQDHFNEVKEDGN